MTLLLDRLRAALAGRFQVEAELGRGGMATVYRAQDPKHDRHVALKVLHPELASAIHAERFFREIRIAARLNHPNILPLLDSGEAEGLLYYVMPLVSGETLRARLVREGQFSVPESLRIAGQIAAALSHAHRQGIIHRDIKPENILLQDGEALVADFGIAYAVSGAGERLTKTGLSVGTPQYMSPEQATGHGALDARSDEYSLACVVYEMLAGEPPLTGPTVQAIIAKLMTERPVRLRTVRDTVPVAVDEAVAQGLAKVPVDRFESVEAFATALTAPAPKLRRWTSRHVAVAVGVGVLAAAGVIGRFAFRRDRVAATPTAATLRQITFTGDANDVAVSPDGKSIAFLGDSLKALVVQDLSGGGRVTIVRDTTSLVTPRWSPDGTRILYGRGIARCYCPTAPGPTLLVVSRLGGPPRVVSLPPDVSMSGYSAFAFGGSDSTFLVGFTTAHGRKIWIYRGDNPGTIRVLGDDSVTASGEVFRLEGPFDGGGVLGRIRLSPDGRWLAVAGAGKRQMIATLPLKSPRPRLTIVDSSSTGTASGLEWAPGGDALYFTRIEGSGGTVLRLDIDRSTGASRGPPRPVQSGLSAPSNFGISADGRRLAVMTGFDRAHLTLIHLASRPGGQAAVTPIPCGTAACVAGTMSPDGRRLAFVRSGNGTMYTFDLAVGAADGSGAERLGTGLEAWGPPPVWSPDARQVFWWNRLTDPSRLVAFDLNSGRERVVWQGGNPARSRISVAADGKRLAFLSATGYVLLTDTVESLVSTDTSGGSPTLSPNGARLAYRVYSGVRVGTVEVLDILQKTKTTVARDPALVPIGWLNDSSLFVLRVDTASWEPRALELLPIRGGPGKLLGVFPKFGIYDTCDFTNVTLSPDWRSAVCSTGDPNTDIWLVEGFDAAKP